MKIDKAIKILSEGISAEHCPTLPEWEAAINLGTEALKVIQRERIGDPPLDGELLPGETD